MLTQDPLFLGVDGEGAAHYWDSYEWAGAVVADDSAQKYDLDRSRTLAQWCEHVRDMHGWDVGLHVSGSLVGDLAAGVDG